MKIYEYLSGKKYLKCQEELLLNMCPERQLKHLLPSSMARSLLCSAAASAGRQQLLL